MKDKQFNDEFKLLLTTWNENIVTQYKKIMAIINKHQPNTGSALTFFSKSNTTEQHSLDYLIPELIGNYNFYFTYLDIRLPGNELTEKQAIHKNLYFATLENNFMHGLGEIKEKINHCTSSVEKTKLFLTQLKNKKNTVTELESTCAIIKERLDTRTEFNPFTLPLDTVLTIDDQPTSAHYEFINNYKMKDTPNPKQR